MRNESEVNVHRAAFKGHERSNGARIHVPRLLDVAEVLPAQPDHSWTEKFLPRTESRSMSDESNKTSGVFLPYPLLGILMTLVLALGGGIIGLYAQLTAMNATMIMRDADHRREQQQNWEKIEQLQVYIHNDRERIGKLEERSNQGRRSN